MNHPNRILLAAVLLSGCIGDSILPRIVTGDGEETTEDRDVSDFTGVSADNFVHVTVATGPEKTLSLTCDANLLPHIRARVEAEVLHIETEPGTSLRTNLDCTAFVTAPRYDRLSSSGSGGLVGDELFEGLSLISNSASGELVVRGADADGLEVDLSGSGSILVGEALTDTLFVRDSASGSIDIVGITADAVEVRGSGSGSIQLAGQAVTGELRNSASGSIDAEDLHLATASIAVSGSGSVAVTVAEFVDVDISSSGSVEVFGQPEHTESISGSGSVVYR